MVRNTKTRVPLLRSTKLRDVLQQVLFFPWFQNHRIQQTRRVAVNAIPPVVIYIQVRVHSLTLEMALHDIIHKALQTGAVPADRPKGKSFKTPARSFTRVLRAGKPNLKRPATKPEPVLSRRRQHGNPLVAERGI